MNSFDLSLKVWLNNFTFFLFQTTASPDGTYSFTCQHGPVECQGNIIHSCAVSLVADKSLLVKYVGCMIANNINPEEIGASVSMKQCLNVTILIPFTAIS